MPAPPTATRYTRTAVALHWLLAAAILGAIAVGAYADDLPLSPQKLKLVNWHKWAGITILALSLLRLAWRLGHRPPPAPPMPAWQARAATATHAAMYALFLAVPLAGWSYSAAAGFPVVLFGLWPLPDPVPKDRALADLLRDVHGALAWTLAMLVVLHVAAALKHQFVDRDGLIGRMRWGRP
jgi:cytochrome b561